MRSDWPVVGVAAVAALMFGTLIGSGASSVAAVVVFAIFGLLVVAWIGWSIRTDADASWLPKWIVLGFLAKMGGTLARFYMVTEIYGIGDSYRYHRAGTELALAWRTGDIPELSGAGSLGTQVVEFVTGALFALITPDMLGGFVLFAILAYLGQLMLYAAFRVFAQPHQLKPYAILLFLLPTYAFWPSSIGKDALVLLTLGAAAYFVARSLRAYEIRYLVGLGLSLAALGLIRIHIAGLVAIAFAVAAIISKSSKPSKPGAGLRRVVVAIGGIMAVVAVVAFFPDVFGVDIRNSQDLDGFTADVVRRTSESGTVASGGPVTNPLELPAAIGHVLFRPFPLEANELQHYFAAAETFLIVVMSVWRLPAIVRNLRRWRVNPYLVFSTIYTIGFSVAFSVVRNLGIIARQRGQVLAFFLCFIIGLGWRSPKPDEEETVIHPYRSESLVG